MIPTLYGQEYGVGGDSTFGDYVHFPRLASYEIGEHVRFLNVLVWPQALMDKHCQALKRIRSFWRESALSKSLRLGRRRRLTVRRRVAVGISQYNGSFSH